MRPRTMTRPASGARMPAIVRSSVDFPAPLRPITPSTVPFGTVNETSRSAGTSRSDDRVAAEQIEEPGPPRGIEVHAVGRRHVVDLDRGLRDVLPASANESETESKGSLMRYEHPVADDEEEHGPEGRQEHLARRRHTAEHDGLVGGEQREQRVDATRWRAAPA